MTEIVVNRIPFETRVAILENHTLVELHIERDKEKGLAGNIYKGKVERVLPGMQAAFVNIGEHRNAYLHVSDIKVTLDEYGEPVPLDHYHATIEELLKEGQEIMVQVVKDPIDEKGPKITTNITIPGRYLVLLPFKDRIAISRNIEDETEKKRLSSILEAIKPKGLGFIIRTACEGAGEMEMRSDIDYLIKTWKAIERRFEREKAPALLYRELELPFRILRDYRSTGKIRIYVDDEKLFEGIRDFICEYITERTSYTVLHYRGKKPIFEEFMIEEEIPKILSRKVWLKSGAYITIDETEALVAIDVNTGRYTGEKIFEETATKVNLEAAKEIAYQIRLRNLAGIIIVDFIDMKEEANRDKVMETLKHHLSKDRVKSLIYPFSPLGLLTINRKRTGPSLKKTLLEECPFCEGRGMEKSKRTVCYEILRKILSLKERKIKLVVNPELAGFLLSEEKEILTFLEKEGYKVKIDTKEDKQIWDYTIIPCGS